MDADDKVTAIRTAARTAKNAKDEEWNGSFDANSYGYDAEIMTDGEASSDYTRYALLRADLFSGEGSLVPQPWMKHTNPLLLADLSSDWGEQVEGLSESSAGEYVDWLEAQKPPANLIPFPLWPRDII